MKATEFLRHDKVRQAQAKFFLNLPFWVAATLVALVSVAYNKLFKLCEEWAFAHAGGLYYLTVPLGLLISFLLAYFVSREAQGSGIPHVIASIEMSTKNSPGLSQILSLRMILTKIAGSCAAILGGGVAGREGPTLQISAALFYQVHRIWPKSWAQPSLSSMILSGGAAGLASAFNTPLGGVVFAIEELSKFHISSVRTAVFQGVLVAGILAQIFLGNYLYLGQVDFGVFPWSVLLNTILIAAVVGLVSGTFAEGLFQVSRWRSRMSFPKQLGFTLFFGFVLAALIWWTGPTSGGSGKELIVEILNDPTDTTHLQVPVGRIAGSFLTYVSGVIGGIFAPALASGASLGQFLAQILSIPSVKLMAMVGMVSFLTGITRSPFTSFVLVLEMTNAHQIILYLMLASLVSNLAARLISHESLYEKLAHVILQAEKKSEGDLVTAPIS